MRCMSSRESEFCSIAFWTIWRALVSFFWGSRMTILWMSSSKPAKVASRPSSFLAILIASPTFEQSCSKTSVYCLRLAAGGDVTMKSSR